MEVHRTSYTSVPVDIPASFLSPLPSGKEITVTQIHFEHTAVPQYKGALAFILDGVLSQEECDTLIKLAEQSTGIDPEKDNPWQPAMINGGIGYEFLDKTYRNSDRIIWDNPDLVSRLWQRCLQAEGIQEKIGELSDETHKQVLTGYTENTKWVVTKQGWNERMRF